MKYLIIVIIPLIFSCAAMERIENNEYHLRYHTCLKVDSIVKKRMYLSAPSGNRFSCPIYADYFKVNDTIDLSYQCKEVAYVHNYLKYE